MYIYRTRVSYSDTDKMGYVHHSNYLKYYENARWELLRRNSMSYKEIEESSILMPVVRSEMKFLKPAFYDDILTVQTKCIFKGAKLVFYGKILNDSNEIINSSRIEVALVDEEYRRPRRPHKNIIELIDSINRKEAHR